MRRFYKAQTVIRMRKLVICCLILFAAAVSLVVDNPAMGYPGEGWPSDDYPPDCEWGCEEDIVWEGTYVCTITGQEPDTGSVSGQGPIECFAEMARAEESCQIRGLRDGYDFYVEEDCHLKE